MRFPFILMAASCLILVGCNKATDTAASNNAAPAQNAPAAAATPPPSADAAQGDLTGKWTGTSEPGPTKLTYEFKGDTYTQNTENTIPGSTSPLITETEGTYKVDGAKMTVKATKMQMSTEDPKLKADFEKTNAVITPDYLSKQPPQEWTLEWKDKDNIVIKSEAKQGTLTATLKRDAGTTPSGDSAGGSTGPGTTG